MHFTLSGEFVMSGIKHAFEKIGDGIKHTFEGIGKDVGGAFKVVGGALTANPDLMKSGANEFESGLKQTVSGVAETADGSVDLAMNTLPLGIALSAVAGPSAQNFVDGTFNSATNIVNDGIDGASQIGGGIMTGNVGEIAQGLGNVAPAALLFVPGAGEAEIAGGTGQVMLHAGKELTMQSAEAQFEG